METAGKRVDEAIAKLEDVQDPEVRGILEKQGKADLVSWVSLQNAAMAEIPSVLTEAILIHSSRATEMLIESPAASLPPSLCKSLLLDLNNLIHSYLEIRSELQKAKKQNLDLVSEMVKTTFRSVREENRLMGAHANFSGRPHITVKQGFS